MNTKRVSYLAVSWSSVLIAALVILSSGGCAISQEGAVDYRIARSTTEEERRGNVRRSDGKQPSAPVGLHYKLVNIPAQVNAEVKKGDSIAIRLSQAFIADFVELTNPFSGRENGEIAVVVNAFEYGAGDNSVDFDFGPGGVEKGRLVFYSADVEEGQFLNMVNMPIYGPITYNGNPIGLDVSIIELDSQNSEQIKVLLSTLANAGAKAYPPAAPVLPLLDKLGSALLSGNTDDTVFRFSFVLDPPTPYRGLAYPRVEAGNYVFIREKNRQSDTSWDKLEFDENTGRLYCREGAAQSCNGSANTERPENERRERLYRENTYLVFQINKGFDSSDIDLSQNTYGDLLSKLKVLDQQKAGGLKSASTEMGILMQRRIQKRSFIAARQKLQEFMAARKDKEKTGEAKRAAFDLYTMLHDAVANLVRAADDTKEPKSGEAFMSEQDVELLLGRLRSIGNITNEDALGKFTVAGFANLGFREFFELIGGVKSLAG